MQIPSNYRSLYKIIETPTDKVLAYYNSKLKGESQLQGYLPAISVSDKLDEYITSSIEEQYKAPLFRNADAIDKLKLWSTEGYIRIKTKYACARIIQILREIEWLQNKIQESPYVYLSMSPKERANYNTNEVHTEMVKCLDRAHSLYESIKKWQLEDNFVKTVFPLVDNTLSSFYMRFKLDYTPTSQKIKEEAEGCTSEIIITIILLGIVALLAMIFVR